MTYPFAALLSPSLASVQEVETLPRRFACVSPRRRQKRSSSRPVGRGLHWRCLAAETVGLLRSGLISQLMNLSERLVRRQRTGLGASEFEAAASPLFLAFLAYSWSIH